MAKRKIIRINENKCNGCGNCVTGCHEGALQIIDGKAKLVNESFCDGFGDCIGECPTGALVIEEREAEEFDLQATAEHVKDLRGEEAVEEMLAAQEVHDDNENDTKPHSHSGGCPGSRMRVMKTENNTTNKNVKIDSELEQWPVQIHLLSPNAPYFENADLLVTADCVPTAYANYHQDLLKGKAVALGCPKLDDANAYIEKFTQIIANNNLNSITIARMEVPCCGGLVHIVEEAIKAAQVDLNVEIITVGIDGELK
ncbi:ATP-binding protein [Selenihalanaerobacter shriftii]|uniref:4Fe-4S binding domain-containing protein n=1 Tax=Selenihalanaerobacter shriftii TaxID=142842 RepID=A0A1T4LG43_9FIRM|nr:4Fe-4S dicluster domain-containing protein [Selenihalanaerobacter shriftii]SJZ53548.1 4Fe-4S binding domain-containing protein [Selenihalanaerobacter shriftii]